MGNPTRSGPRVCCVRATARKTPAWVQSLSSHVFKGRDVRTACAPSAVPLDTSMRHGPSLSPTFLGTTVGILGNGREDHRVRARVCDVTDSHAGKGAGRGVSRLVTRADLRSDSCYCHSDIEVDRNMSLRRLTIMFRSSTNLTFTLRATRSLTGRSQQTRVPSGGACIGSVSDARLQGHVPILACL